MFEYFCFMLKAYSVKNYFLQNKQKLLMNGIYIYIYILSIYVGATKLHDVALYF